MPRRKLPLSGGGNGLLESSNLALAQDTYTSDLCVITTEHIPSGKVVAEYLGVMKLCRPRSGIENNVYRLQVSDAPRKYGSSRVVINASKFGSIARFMNHSCEANARSHIMARGSRRTVVVVTSRAVEAGEELTVNNGSNLWFVCECGLYSCQHRGIRPEIPTHHSRSHVM